VWHNPNRDKGHLRVLNTVQRAALLRIVSAFRSVATQVLEVECHILPTRLGLKQRGQEVVLRLCSLPSTHPPARVMDRVRQRVNQRGTRPRFPLAKTTKSLNNRELESLETLDPIPLPPWKTSESIEITIDPDRS